MLVKTTKLNEAFGLVIEPGTVTDPLALDMKKISDWFRSSRALYFKGWNFDLATFQEFSGQLSKNFSSYEGGGFRFKELDREFVNGDKTTMTTTGHTQGFSIPLHGEMHYMGTPPPLIWFYCKTPGVGTGQTTISDGKSFAEQLPPEVRSFFTQNKIKYIRYLQDGMWQSSFITEDPERAKEICRQQKVSFTYDAEKKEFITEYTVSPFSTKGYAEGVKWVNNILNIASVEWAFDSGWIKKAFTSDFGERCPMIVRMEDGTKIPLGVLDQIRATAEANTLNLEWEAGEVVMIDNLSVMHGRRESLNPAREVFVRMGDPNF
ncbi:MAG TPA: TauD/TfdA family dioxygenase [Chitinophagaceae bacterium]|jgi:alpha-ketoglutarate-dependent taurine dioxygenase|nr:TauD/TfdA family dioxygenase [Chitinophagaceae bacterium]